MRGVISYHEHEGDLWVVLARCAMPEGFFPPQPHPLPSRKDRDGDILMKISKDAYVDIADAKLIIDRINELLGEKRK